MKNKDLNIDHRKRMYKKVLEKGEEALTEVEILEMILFAVHKRKDTRIIAKKLLHEFKTLAETINAPDVLLKKIPQIGSTSIVMLRVLRIAIIKICEEKIIKKNVISTWNEAIEFCRMKIGNRKIEHCEVIYLNHRNEVIKCKNHQRGTVNSTSIYPREILKEALEIDAGAIILAHNHPNGNKQPSRQDILLTENLAKLLKEFDICLHDHLIITDSDHFSFKSNGLIL